jgi:hypothetical protein
MRKKSLVKQFLGFGSWTSINKPLMKKIGLDCTYMFQYLLDLQENCFEGEFFQQQERLAEEFGWTLYKVQTVIKQLVGYQLLSVTKKGLPAKNYYSINEDQVLCILEDLTQILSSENIEDKSAGIDIHNSVDNIIPSDVEFKALVPSKAQHIEHTNSKQPKETIIRDQPNLNKWIKEDSFKSNNMTAMLQRNFKQ